MFHSQSIFISEVRKRLAKKRLLQMKNRPMITDEIPLEKIKYHRQSLLLSYSNFKNNQKYIENFIREKSYKSILNKRKRTIKKKNKANLLSHNKNNTFSKTLKFFSNSHSCLNMNSKINKKIKILKLPKKTPFQIHHIKIQYFKDYINNSREKNRSNNMKEESKIKSFSINKYNEKKRIFGKSINKNNKLVLKNNKIAKFYFSNISHKNKSSHNSINYQYNDLNNKEKNELNNNICIKLLKPNNYFNLLNMNKVSKKRGSYEYSI